MEMKEFTDIDGIKRVFEFRQFSVPTGHKYEAGEIQDSEPKGMVFSVLGEETDSAHFKNELIQKIKQTLATKHIKYDERTDTWLAYDSIIRGQINWDSKSEEL